MNVTGESTASINARADKRQMPKVMAALQEGAVLWQPNTGFDYYIRKGNTYGGMGSLTPAGIRKLESEGTIELVGVKTYALKKG